ncbi:MAG: pilus assembly protein [Parvibaculum sp.]|nr:pilus assembly protein [Parvibaculum sp.]|tara:strand:- start:1003 stop:1569 length:567 start_codon:yes stop_codon:yes gene_type:complete
MFGVHCLRKRVPKPACGSHGDFQRDERGSVAVEFALTAIPFFTLLFAIMEAGIIFFASATLDQSVNDAARLVRTGQAQTAGTTVQQMTNTICGKVVLLSDCANKLKLDVRVYSNFSSVAFPTVLDDSGAIQNNKLAFGMGSAGDIVLIRAFYVWSIMSPFSTGLANNASGSNRLLQSSSAFRNEPYTS